jgi:hypothetical protein
MTGKWLTSDPRIVAVMQAVAVVRAAIELD